jgi:hypothetical protein
MVRTISADLLTAAQDWRSAPVVTAMPARTSHAWWSVHQDAVNTPRPTDAAAAGSILIRARANNGSIEYQRITDVTVAAQFTSWTVLATGARADSDIAVANIDYPGNNFAIYWQENGTDHVYGSWSTDGGLNWNTPWAVLTGYTGHLYLAADWQNFYTQNSTNMYYQRPTHDAWTTAALGSPCIGAMANPYGVAFANAAPGNHWGVLVWASDNVIKRARVFTNSVAYTRTISHGMDQSASTNATPKYPGLARLLKGGTTADNHYAATWIIQNTAAPAAHQEIVQFSIENDGYYFGAECSLPVENSAFARMSVALVHGTKELVVGHDCAAHYTPHWPLGDSDGETYKVTPTAYRRIKQRHAPGTLQLEFIDPTGLYRSHNARGNASMAAGFFIGNTVVVSRGWHGASGDETEATAPHYITGVKRGSYSGGGHVTVEATDAFGLLELTRIDRVQQYVNRSLGWLAEAVCAWAGVGWQISGDTIWVSTIPWFTINPGTTARAALIQLLTLAGAVATATEDGDIQAHVLVAYTQGSTPTIGNQDEIESAAFGVGLSYVTSIDVAGDSYIAHAESAPGASAQGRRFAESHTDLRIVTQAHADKVVAYYLALAQMDHDLAQVVVPLRPDLEIWDEVDIDADSADVSSGMNPKVITRIEERYDTRIGRMHMELRVQEYE